MKTRLFFMLLCLPPTLVFSQEPTTITTADSMRAAQYENKGKQFFENAKYDSAAFYFEHALAVFKAANQEESLRSADIYGLLGKTCYAQGDYQQAIAFFNDSIKLKKKQAGGEGTDLAWLYNSIGNADYMIGNFDEAYEYYQHVLFFFSKSTDDKNKAIASANNNIGMIFFEKRDYKKSLEYFEKALAMNRRLKGENDISTTPALNNIGLCHWKLYEIDAAIDCFQKALSIRKKAYGENHPAVASSYHYIGEAYRLKNNLDSALVYYRKSLKINRSLFGEHHPKYAEDYNAIGTLYVQNHRYRQALQSYQRAIIALVPSFSDTTIYHNPPIAERLSDKYLIYSLIRKANAFAKLSETPERSLLMAMDTYNLAAELVDRIILGYRSDEAKLYLAGYEEEISEHAIATLADLYAFTGEKKYVQQQFKFLQKAKFAVLQKSLHDVQAAQISGIPDSLLQRENKIREDISFYETQLQKEVRKKANQDSVKATVYREKTFALKQDHKDLISRFEKEYPQYYHLKYLPRGIMVSDVQANLGRDDIMLDYFLTEKSVRIFAISQNDFAVDTVAIDSNFVPLIDSFRRRIKKVDLSHYADEGLRIYRTLIQPVAERLDGKKHIIIIPHMELYQIPFEALISRPMPADLLDFSHADYLIDKFEISYYISAELFVENFSKQRLADVHEPAEISGFVGYAPVFSEQSNTETIFTANRPTIESAAPDRSVSIDGKNFTALEYSKSEVEGIADLFTQKKMPAIGYFYADASEGRFKELAKNFKFVHVATHGIIDDQNPNLSGIIFAQPTDSLAGEDGILYAAETYNLNLNADLLALSSCESGVGKLVRGEGLLSLTRGFIYSGARNLLVSLWKVSDKNTRELMLDFYSNVLDGKSYSCALRQAKLHMIRNSGTSFPKLWSGFILIGE